MYLAGMLYVSFSQMPPKGALLKNLLQSRSHSLLCIGKLP